MSNPKNKKGGTTFADLVGEVVRPLLASRSLLVWFGVIAGVLAWAVILLTLSLLWRGTISISQPAAVKSNTASPTLADSSPFIEWHWWTVAKNTTLDQCVRMAKDVHEIRDGRGRHEVMARTGSVANYGDITGALFCLQEGTGPDAEVIAFVVAAGLDGSQAKSHAISLGELFRQKTGAR